mmetsp:Transcript_12676/g.23693  ORF Transcript_12676/g.23693 Transcript_12676/m.23693 type:complete len:253 (+) Transcript_12676:424-1182(+)
MSFESSFFLFWDVLFPAVHFNELALDHIVATSLSTCQRIRHIPNILLNRTQLIGSSCGVALDIFRTLFFCVFFFGSVTAWSSTLSNLKFFLAVHERPIQKVDIGRDGIETHASFNTKSSPIEKGVSIGNATAFLNQFGNDPVCIVTRHLNQLIDFLRRLGGDRFQNFTVQDRFADVPYVSKNLIVTITCFIDFQVLSTFFNMLLQQSLFSADLATFFIGLTLEHFKRLVLVVVILYNLFLLVDDKIIFVFSI